MPRALHMLRTDALRRPKLLLEIAQEGSTAEVELRLPACCCTAPVHTEMLKQRLRLKGCKRLRKFSY